MTIATDKVVRGGMEERMTKVKIVLGLEGAHDLILDSGQQTEANSLPVVLPATQIAELVAAIAASGGASTVTFTPTRPALPDNISTVLIASNANRTIGSYAVNNTGVTIWLQYGAVAVLNQGVEWIPGQVFKFDTKQEIRGIQNSGGSVNPDFFEAT